VLESTPHLQFLKKLLLSKGAIEAVVMTKKIVIRVCDLLVAYVGNLWIDYCWLA
jgi:hypothetical protein